MHCTLGLMQSYSCAYIGHAILVYCCKRWDLSHLKKYLAQNTYVEGLGHLPQSLTQH
jgi:hypothetical protein